MVKLHIEDSFWKAFPNLKSYFKSIYEEDNSKGKVNSSELMYSMYLCYHYEGEFINLSDIDKVKVLNDLFKTTQSNILELIEINLTKFYDLIETPARKALREWNEKTIERTEFIKNTKYSLDYYEEIETRGGDIKRVLVKGTWEMLDDMRSKNVKMMQDYFDILKKLNQETDKKQGESGAELSLSDKGEI